jgi:alpha-glucosidase (family GH31 glycosyl hydrolase)
VGETFDGPTVLTVHAPLDTLPLFVRGGAVLPGTAPTLSKIPEGLIDPLIVDVYPHGASTYRLVEDEGLTDFACVRDERGLTFTWTGGPERVTTLRFHGVPKPSRMAPDMGWGPVERWEVAADGTVQVQVRRCRGSWLRIEGE